MTDSPKSGAENPDAESARRRGNRQLDAGDWKQAEISYRLALQFDSNSLPAHIGLGYVLIERQAHAEAVILLERALQLDPDDFDVNFMLGQLASARADWNSCIEYLESARRTRPDFAPIYGLFCSALVAVGKRELALVAVDDGLIAAPHDADLHRFRGNLLLNGGNLVLAVDSYRRSVQLAPGEVEAQLALATALKASGDADGALAAYDQAIKSRPNEVRLLESRGSLQLALSHTDDAIESFRRLTEIEGASSGTWSNLAAAYLQADQLDASLQCCRKAQVLDPRNAHAVGIMATIEVQRGMPEAALDHFQKSIDMSPGNLEARSNQLFVMTYCATPEQYLAAAREYGKRANALARSINKKDESIVRTSQPSHQGLKVGFVSGDLRAHPVGYFIENVLPSLREQGIITYAFTTTRVKDNITERLKSHFASWHSIAGFSDEDAARQIQACGVHLLIDLAGHTAHNRLPVFAWRPAPVQISWLGYFASTGLDAIDYVLADRVSVPPKAATFFTETVWYLPETRMCFSEPGKRCDFPVAPTPASKNGYITFGSYQNLNKFSAPVLISWQRILAALPNARLRLQSRHTGAQRSQVLQKLLSHGINAAQVQLIGPSSRENYLRSYAQVDILLDTFPFPGGTTTCEALWMGVPTLTFSGDSMLARQGALLLNAAGLGSWVTSTVDDYVASAIARASDIEALADLRRGLRQQVVASVLFDGPRFSRQLGFALRQIWDRQAQSFIP